jgi:hypothetical protein
MFKKKMLALALAGVSSQAMAIGGYEAITGYTVGQAANAAGQTNLTPEAVMFSPANVAFLENDINTHVGGFLAFTDYSMYFLGQKELELKNDDPQPVPAFTFTYDIDECNTLYFGAGLSGQGGFLSFSSDVTLPGGEIVLENPIPILDPLLSLNYESLTLSDVDLDMLFIGNKFGIARKLSDNISVSLGVVATYAWTNADLDLSMDNATLEIFGQEPEFAEFINLADIDTNIDAFGMAPEVGFYWNPKNDWDFSARYLFRTKMEYTGRDLWDEVENNILGAIPKDSEIGQALDAELNHMLPLSEQRRDLPAILMLGVGYNINENHRVNVGYNNIDESNVKADYYDWDDTHEYAIGYTWRATDALSLSATVGRTDKGAGEEHLQALDAMGYGLGFAWNWTDSLQIIGSVGYVDYDGSSDADREEITAGLGINMGFDSFDELF